jgi:hypothetical protein
MNEVMNEKANESANAKPTATKKENDGRSDFDFLMGSWQVRNRRLHERLKGSMDWEEFDATNLARPLVGGIGNEDEFVTEHDGGATCMSFRFFNPTSGQWSIYWINGHRGFLEPPVVGGFVGGEGIFSGADTHAGRAILVRYVWSRVQTPTPRWEQAFSADGGRTWETNWIMDFRR